MVNKPFDRALLDETTRHVEERLGTLAPGVLVRRPMAQYLAAFDEDERIARYAHVPGLCAKVIAEIAIEGTSDAAELYQQLALLTLISQFDERRTVAGLPSRAMSDLERAFGRIVEQIRRGAKGYYAFDNDLFMKDLQVCRLRLIPSGPEVIDLCSGVPRSILLSAGARQLLGGSLFFLFRARGLRPFLELHSHRWAMGEFNEPGYKRCYAVVAALMLAHPDSRGLLSKSWWHDPRVAEISPELTFLTDTPLENGARRFRGLSDANTIADATRFAPARKEAFEEGGYVPRNYLIVWPRRELLAWAEVNRQQTG